MAKSRRKSSRSGGCTPRRISFRANGRTVSFMGRPAGGGRSVVGRKIAKSKYGGSCSPSPAVTTARREIAKVARQCARKTHGKGKQKFRLMGACVRREWAAA